jgi:hypothetical protein
MNNLHKGLVALAVGAAMFFGFQYLGSLDFWPTAVKVTLGYGLGWFAGPIVAAGGLLYFWAIRPLMRVKRA